jgi:hypothetical protein
MALLPQCQTTHATIIVGYKCPDGVIRCPTDAGIWPGINLSVNPLLPINSQLIDTAQAFVLNKFKVTDVVQECLGLLEPKLEIIGSESSLYVGYLQPAVDENLSEFWPSWRTFPDILRSLANNRSRLPYLKAWQIFAGGLSESTKAIELDDLKKALTPNP